MFKIRSIVGRIHDTGYGGYPFKVVVKVEMPVKYFNKICPIISKTKHTLCGRIGAKRDLGNLVLDVNNAVYAINNNIPAYNPSIDSNGHKRAKNGVKTMEFVYFFSDYDKAEALGFKMLKIPGKKFVSWTQEPVLIYQLISSKGE